MSRNSWIERPSNIEIATVRDALREEARLLIVHPSALIPSLRHRVARFELRAEIVTPPPAVRVEV